MSGIRPVLRLIALAYYRWAAREICPLHPDAAYVHRRVYELERTP